jgi:hypothetical protein
MLIGLAQRVYAGLVAAPPPSPSPAPGGGCNGRVAAINLDDGAQAPGVSGFQHLANIVAVYALIGCLLAFVGGIFLTTSGRFADHRVAAGGRMAMIAGVAGAFGIGIAAAVVNFAFNSGTSSC